MATLTTGMCSTGMSIIGHEAFPSLSATNILFGTRLASLAFILGPKVSRGNLLCKVPAVPPSLDQTVLHEYQRNNSHFVISVADGCNAVQYHNQVQTLATWFIETADGVNVASQDGGYWKVLYLFRRNAPGQYSLAGYFTIFHFLSPFKRPKSGIVARVCQALILPPYQRMGHGKMLLKTLYELATDDPSNDIVEINVEDPARSFVALRNRVDYELFQESMRVNKHLWLVDSMYYTIRDVHNVDFFRGVTDGDAVAAGAVARITPRQVQICHELYKLSLVNNVENEEATRQYRIMVKRRLAKDHREKLGACRSKEEKQALLGKIFDETMEQYKSVLHCK
jgi:histone acetyltransferase 1